MKCAVIGGVQSTAVLIKALYHHGFEDVKVYGFEPPNTELVSGWRDLRTVAESCSFTYRKFHKVIECKSDLEVYKPNVLFVVGLSQLIPKAMLEIASDLNVGFHPTALPKGRGRAAIAWLIMSESNGAATFFEIEEGVDNGAILVQEKFEVSRGDYAFDVERKLLRAEEEALNKWLPLLRNKKINKQEQDERLASWYGRRSPEDGWINWSLSSSQVLKTIRASSRPHPGAFTFCDNVMIIIWKATNYTRDEIGVSGRILMVNKDDTFVVQAGEGLILVEEWEGKTLWKPRVGLMLGYYLELENYNLRKKMDLITERLNLLENALLKRDLK